jgi:hypothetical protein
VRRATIPFLILAGLLAGCGNAGKDLGFGVRKAKGLDVLVYFDRNGSGFYDKPADTATKGIGVELLRQGVIPAIDSAGTNDTGGIRFSEIDPGYYLVVVDTGFLSDSIAATRTPSVTTIRAGDQVPQVQVALAPPLLALDQVRAGSVGKTVLVEATITAGRQSYGDGSAYIVDSTGSMRMERVRNLSGNPANFPGDIVRVRGRIALTNGHPVLDTAQVFLAGTKPEPLPATLTTGEAANAGGGVSDAALVRIVGATIVDTATPVGGVFTAGVNDGSGRVELRIDPLLFATLPLFAPGALIDCTGVLVPSTPVVWQLWPRTRDDFVIH